MHFKVFLKYLFEIVTRILIPLLLLAALIFQWNTFYYQDTILIIGMIIIFVVGIHRCIILYSVFKKTSLYEYEASIMLLTIFTINYIS